MDYEQILHNYQPYYVKRTSWLTLGRAELMQVAMLGRIAHRIVHKVKLVDCSAAIASTEGFFPITLIELKLLSESCLTCCSKKPRWIGV